MAVQVYCEVCKTSNDVAAKRCKKCGATFSRDKTFRVDVTVKGRRITRQAPNLTVARELEASLKTELLREEFDISVHKSKKVLTLDDIWEKYLPWAKEHKKSWKDDELYYGKHIDPRFGKKTLDAISPIDLERMKIEMRKGTNKNGKPYAAATIKHQIVIIRRLYNLAKKWQLYDGPNPVSSVQMPKLDNQKTEFLTEEEFQRLMDTIASWPYRPTACLFKFALFTGLRQGELRKLQWNDVDFEHSMVTLQDPKGSKTETIPISAEALEILREMETVSEYVFPNPDGGMKAKSSIIDTWKSMKKHADIPTSFRFHGLRHNFASWLVSNGVDLATVQKLMSHQNASTTQRYAHLMPGAAKDAASKSGKLFTAAAKKDKTDNVVELRK